VGELEMLKFIKYLLILVIFIPVGCAGDGISVEEEELKLEFENIWWEIVEVPAILTAGGEYCYYFDSTRLVEPPNNGAALSYKEGDKYSYVFSDFERLDGGYYLSRYDMTLEIYVDEEGNYSGKIAHGLLEHTTEIIPCSLGV
tara:strand:+ start:3579 stop:4007 length:429 start_codon:yes stop_codon:yes gene_type:complete